MYLISYRKNYCLTQLVRGSHQTHEMKGLSPHSKSKYKKKEQDYNIKNPSWEGNVGDTVSFFFSFVTQLPWTYCSPLLVSQAAGCCPRKQEKLIYLAHGLKEELLFPYAHYGIKVLISTANSCQIFVSFVILVASETNLHCCGTGQGIRFKMFSIPQGIICHQINLA